MHPNTFEHNQVKVGNGSNKKVDTTYMSCEDSEKKPLGEPLAQTIGRRMLRMRQLHILHSIQFILPVPIFCSWRPKLEFFGVLTIVLRRHKSVCLKGRPQCLHFPN